MTIAFALVVVVMIALALLTEKGGGSATGMTATTRTVTDQAGRRVELPAKVTRVGADYRIATEILIGLGAGDTLVGKSSASRSQAELYSKFLPGYEKKPNTGSATSSNTEQIASLKPDVVIVGLAKGAGMAKIEQLEAVGIRAVGIKCESLDELAEGVELLGEVVGREERAREYLDLYNRTREMIAGRLAGLKDSERVRVYVSGSGGILSTCGCRMYQSSMIELAGGENVAGSVMAGGWANVSPEQLIKWNPSWIFLVQYGHSMGPRPMEPRDVLQDTRFSTIDAVRTGKVVMFPSNISPWDYPSMQAVLGLLWAAKTLHPDRFEDVDMAGWADDFYLKFFNKSFRKAGGVLRESPR